MPSLPLAKASGEAELTATSRRNPLARFVTHRLGELAQWRQLIRVGLRIIAALLLMPAARAERSDQIEQPVLDWINSNAHPLTTTDPNGTLDDLEPLKSIVGAAVVVGLGEATHGSHELWTVRQRILRYLVERMGFTGFVLEAPWPVGQQLDEYVLHGNGDLSAILGPAWPLDSQEMADLFRWIRSYNAAPDHPNKVRIAAMDISLLTPEMFDRVTRYVKDTDPGLLSQVQQGYAGLRVAALEKNQSAAVLPKKYESLPPGRKAKLRSGTEHVEQLLRSHEKQLVDRSSRQAFDSALESAQVISQFARFGFLLATDRPAGFTEHERAMATNAAWWHDRVGKTIVWAHDAHIAKHTMLPKVYPGGMTGTFLREQYGDKYITIATSFGQGAYTAMETDPNAPAARGATSRMITIKLDPLPADSSTSVLNQVKSLGYILDLRGAPPAVRTWLEQPRSFQIGLAAAVDDPKWLADNTLVTGALASWFDVLVHLREVTAGHPSSWTVH
jgi:erythromycin esterase